MKTIQKRTSVFRRLLTALGALAFSLAVLLMGLLDMLKQVDISPLLGDAAGVVLALLGLLGILLTVVVKGKDALTPQQDKKPDEGF